MASKGKMTKMAAKVKKVMHEFKEGELHAGSKKGPKVTNRKQAIAIGLSEARKSEHKPKELHDHPTLRVVGSQVRNSTAKEDKIRAMMSNTPAFA